MQFNKSKVENKKLEELQTDRDNMFQLNTQFLDQKLQEYERKKLNRDDII